MEQVGLVLHEVLMYIAGIWCQLFGGLFCCGFPLYCLCVGLGWRKIRRLFKKSMGTYTVDDAYIDKMLDEAERHNNG